MMNRRLAISGAIATLNTFAIGCKNHNSEDNNISDNGQSIDRYPLQQYTKPSSYASDLIPGLGHGYDFAFGTTLAPLLVGDVVDQRIESEDTYSPNGLRYSLIENQSDYSSFISKNASGKGRYGIYSGSASAAATKDSNNTSYALHVMAFAHRPNPQKKIIRPDFDPTRVGEIRKLNATPGGRLELLSRYGDYYVEAVSSGSELVVDIMFETQSETQKRSLKAEIGGAVSKLGSGSAGYNALFASAKSYKRISASFLGISENAIPRNYDKDDVYIIIDRFFKEPVTESLITSVLVSPTRDLLLEGSGLNWSTAGDIQKRGVFSTLIQDILSDLNHVLIDIDYVKRNRLEFEDGVFERATVDEKRVQSAVLKIRQRYDEAYASFRDKGFITDRMLDIVGVRAIFPADLNTYPQIDNVSPSQPASRSKKYVIDFKFDPRPVPVPVPIFGKLFRKKIHIHIK